MSENFEKLSALIDDELSDSDLKHAKNLFESKEDEQYYIRQNMIKDVLHGEQVSPIPENFASKISAQIADEPAIFAPNNISKKSEVKQKVVGLAIAASVAMMSFIVLQNDSFQIDAPKFNQQEVAKVIRSDNEQINTTAPQIAVRNTSGYQLASDSQTINPNKWQGLNQHKGEAYKTMINQYLATHTEVSTVNSIQGIMPYSKIVGDDSK